MNKIFSMAAVSVKELDKYKTILLSFTVLLLYGCSAAPDKSEIEEAVVKHFETKGYKVIDIKIGDISSIPISKKVYMGTPGYMVDVQSLTLQPDRENTGNSRMGEKLTFTNARIRVQQHPGPNKGWLITYISGINVP